MTRAAGEWSPGHGRVLTDAAHGLAAWVAPLAVTFVTAPIIVGSLGADGYAIYALAVAYAAAAAAFGPGRGIVHELAGETDAIGRGRILVAGYIAAILMGTAAATLFGVAAPLLSSAAGDVVSVPTDGPMRLAVFSVIPSAVFAASMAICQGLRRFDLMAILTAGQAVTLAVGSAVIARMGFGAAGVMTWYVATASVGGLVSIGVVHSLMGSPGTWARPSLAVALRLARFSTSTVTTQLVLALWVVAERAIITIVLGPVAATAWVVALMLGAYLQQAVVTVAQVLVPALRGSRLDSARLDLYRRATVVAAIVSAGGAAAIAGAGHGFLSLWMGSALADQAATVLLPLAIAFGLNALSSVTWFVNEGRGRPDRNAVVAAAWTVVGLAALWWLLPAWRLGGAGAARLAAQGLTPLYIRAGERAGGGSGAPWGSLLAWIIPSACLLGVVLKMALEHLPRSWWVFAAVCVASLAAYLAAVWSSPALSRDDRASVRMWIAGLVRRR